MRTAVAQKSVRASRGRARSEASFELELPGPLDPAASLEMFLEIGPETIERRVESADGETLTAILGLMLFERHVPEHDRAGRAAKGGKRRSSPSPARTRKPRRPSR